MDRQIQAKTRGRPRAFDVDAALDNALSVFWQHGYEGTSLDDLTAAMGINRPSLYAAFGNKESLFRKATERYVARSNEKMHAILAEPTCRRVVERFLREVVVGTCEASPRGCLLVGAALTCSEASASIRDALTAARCENERLLRERFERGVVARDLPPGTSAADLARFVTTIMQGLSVHSASGATRDEQLAVVDLALRAFPV